MSVLTADKGLAVTVCQILLYVSHLRVHAALHVGGIVVAPVVEHTFVVHQSRIVQLAEKLRHFKNRLTAEGLVSHRPDQHRRMVFVPVVAGADAVVHHLLPLCLIVRHHEGHVLFPFQVSVPCAVGFQIALRDQIQSIAVTKFIESFVIGIVGSTDRVDIVALHGHNVFYQFLIRDMSARYGTEIVTVRAFKYNPFSI